MDILKKLTIVIVGLCACTLNAADVRSGLTLEVVYCENSGGTDGCAPITHLSGSIGDMAIDPLTGNLFIAQFQPTSEISEGGNIIAVNPSTGSVVDLGMRKKDGSTFVDVPYIPFLSNGLDFTSDGTLYFGVSNLMLATWRRENASDVGEFRTLSSIPLIVDIEVNDSDEILVAVNARGGPQSVYRDAILRVDPNDGFFEPVWQLDEILSTELTIDDPSIIARISSMADGSYFASFAKGEVFKKDASGNISLIHKRDQTTGGVNNPSFATIGGNITLELDSASGHLYAIMPDGSLRLVASGPELASTLNTDSEIVYDGTSVYFTNANRAIYKLSANSGTLDAAISNDLGTISINGETRFQISTTETAVMPQATVTLGTGETTVSDDNGLFSFDNISAGLIEFIVTKENFNPGYYTAEVTASGTVDVASEAVVSQLPGYIAPGLDVEIVATKSEDTINGSSDITMDNTGDLYVMNNSNSTITKIDLDPVTREKNGARVVVEGVGGGSSWFVAVDQDLNIYSSYANDGVFKVQEIPDGVVTLTQSESDPTVVTDGNGVNRMISTAKDVDGGTVLSDGTLIMSSGSGGTDTFNNLVAHSNGSDSVYSRGIPTGSTDPVFSNNDLIKVGSDDSVFVTNSNGNVVKVASNGDVDLVWPGDGSGKNETIGGYSNFSEDFNGNMFVRGSFADAPTAIEAGGSLRMISSDRSQLITAVAGIRSWSGVVWEQDGTAAYIANKHFIYKVKSKNDRLVADELTSEDYVPPSFANQVEPFDSAKLYEHDPSWYESLTVQTELFTTEATPEPPEQEQSAKSSGGTTAPWLLVVLLSVGWLRRKVD